MNDKELEILKLEEKIERMHSKKEIDSRLISDFDAIQIQWGKWDNEYQQLMERFRDRLHCKQKQKKITEYFDFEASS